MSADEPTTVTVPMLFRETEVQVRRAEVGKAWGGVAALPDLRVGTLLYDETDDEDALILADQHALRSIALRGAVQHRQAVRVAEARHAEREEVERRRLEALRERERVLGEVRRWREHLDIADDGFSDWSGPDVLERLVGLGIIAPATGPAQ